MKRNKMGWTLATALVALAPLVSSPAQSAAAAAEGMAQTAAPQADTEAQGALNVLMGAIEANDLAAFTSMGEPAFKTLTKEAFAQVSAQMAPRIKKGYEATYLGKMKKQGYQVSLWKLSFKDEGDDTLATLSLKDGKVGGFFLT